MVNEGPKIGQSLVEIDRLTRGEGPFVLQFGYLPIAERSGDVAPSSPSPFASLADLMVSSEATRAAPGVAVEGDL